MLRRSLFSMLLGNSEGIAVTQESVAEIDMPAYLKTESMMPLVQELEEYVSGQPLELQISTKHAFSISWSARASGVTSLQLGVKAAATSVQSPIELGLHADGYLYIGGIKDKRTLSLENLGQHFQLLLEVHPQVGNQTYAKLTLRDAYGLTLATVKNRDYSTADWAGNLINVGSLLKHLKIEGSTLK